VVGAEASRRPLSERNARSTAGSANDLVSGRGRLEGPTSSSSAAAVRREEHAGSLPGLFRVFVPEVNKKGIVRSLAVFVTIAAVGLGGAASATTPAATPLAKVKVVGAVGDTPTLEFSKPFSAKTSARRVVVAGGGIELAEGQNVTFDFLIMDGRTGQTIQTSFDNNTPPGVLSLDRKKTAALLVTSLVGTKVGGRVLVAAAPKEGLGKHLNGPGGVKKTDTLLFVFDVTAATTPLSRATGEAVTPPAGLPTVVLDATGKPSITVPDTAAPTQLVAQLLIKGTGPVVMAGQRVTVHDVGVIWGSGKQFDSSWDRGTPVDFAIGTGGTIKGLNEGLVGQTVGSQLLLVIPPDKGYGAAGQSFGVSATDTLVYVVDILAAA
jgi:peptidylprolyl isomerase